MRIGIKTLRINKRDDTETIKYLVTTMALWYVRDWEELTIERGIEGT